MRKLILFLLVFVSAKVSAQVYQEMPQYGYRANRMAFDSTLQIPTVCGVPTLKSIVKTNKNGAIAYDSCNAVFYTYNPKTLTWSAVSGGGGNFWETSGSTTLGGTDTIISNNGILTFRGLEEDMGKFEVYANEINLGTSDFINYGIKLIGLNTTTDTSTYKPLGINAGGKIAPLTSWVSGGVAVDTIFRTLGKDSIFYKKNNITYAIKDSVGTNPAPVGYYGAFQDTLTQTAASINTAYPVNLRVTDLSNGITIANNSKIKIANAGIYNIQFSLQLEKTGGSGNMIADIWLRKNEVNIDGTTGKVVLTGSANASPIVAAWNYVIAVSSNDSLELMWATTNDNVVIKASPATSPHPSIPSAILTVTQQSGIMAGTGISPLDTANMLNPYLRKIDTASLSNRINTKQNDLDLLQSIGLGIKGESYGITLTNVTAQLALSSGRISFYPFNWNVSDSIRGIAWFNRATTSVVATNYNGIGIYSLSGGTLTRVTFTANDAAFWTATSNTWTSKSITPFYLTKGVYFIGFQVSGTGTLPTIGCGVTMLAGSTESTSQPPTAVNTNGIKVSSFINNATSSPPSSVAMSALSLTTNVPYFIFY